VAASLAVNYMSAVEYSNQLLNSDVIVSGRYKKAVRRALINLRQNKSNIYLLCAYPFAIPLTDIYPINI